MHGPSKITTDNTYTIKPRKEELELQKYRLKLEQLVEEKAKNLELANQELQALNEELDTSNEELQAANEELNATNEELEFSNNALSKEIEEHKITQAEKAIIEEKLNQFISQSSEAIIIINDKGIVEDWNDTMVQITGITKKNALGKFIWDVTYMMANDPEKAEIVSESFKSNTLRFFEEIKQGNRILQGTESQIRHRDSSHRYIRTTFFPIITTSGNYGGVIISDITQKKANEVELEKYRNELEKLLEQRTERLEQLSIRFNEVYTNSSDAIVFLDILDEGNSIKVFDMNPVAKQLFKISDERLAKDVYIEDLLPEIKVESFRQYILPQLLSGAPVTFTEESNAGNGYWSSTIYPVKDETGKVNSIAAFSRNVTAEHEREKASAVLRSAIESWPYEFWVSNKDGVCLLQNKASQQIWGNLIGKKITDLKTLDVTKQKSLEDESKALQGIPSCTELEFETPEGPRYVLVYTNPIIIKNEIAGFLCIIVDITQQKLADIALRESEKRLSQLLSSVTDYKFTVELTNGEVVNSYHSEGCLAVTGYSPDDLKNNTYLWFEMVHNDDKSLLKEWSEKVNNGIEVEPFEHRIIRKNGEIIWISNTTVLKKDSKGVLLGFDGLISDITKRKNAEIALRESEEKLRTIFNTTKDGIVLLNKNMEVFDINNSALKRTGYSREEILGKNVLGFLVKNEPHAITQQLLSILENDVIDNFETEIIIKNDGSFPVEISASAIHIDKQEMVLLMIRDISERKHLEKQLLHSIINTEERERINFSQELHDGLGPLLSAAKMYTECLAEPDLDPRTTIQDIKKLLEESIRTVKDISFKLSPHILQNYGIEEALKAYAEKVEKSSKTHIVISAVNVDRFDEIIETAIYRVICECINNSLKYAKASIINISLNMKDNSLKIDFSDNGIGFDFNTVSKKRNGIGLLNIQSRLKSINGQFSLQSEIGSGTKISILVPIHILK